MKLCNLYKSGLLLASLLTLPLNKIAFADEFCGLHNNSFQEGESLTYKVYYNLSMVWVGAGEAHFNTTKEKLDNKTVYHVVGDGNSFSSYEWIYKVRDKYESYIDSATMLPLRFVRNVSEGKYKKHEDVTFDHHALKAHAENNKSITIPTCLQDVMSAVYYARNIDYNKYKDGDKITFSMYLDDQVYNIYIRYMGKEVVKTKYGTFNAIRIKPLLIKGQMFKGGEKMDIWVSDDANHLPLRISSPISVGSIKVDMIGYKNLRHALTSQIIN